MVVDDYNVSSQCLPPGKVHMARAKLRALRAKAIFTRRGDQRNKGRSLIQAGQLGQIAGFGELCPFLYFGQ